MEWPYELRGGKDIGAGQEYGDGIQCKPHLTRFACQADGQEFFKSVQGMIGDRAAQPLTPDGLHHYDQPDRDLEET
jgi:hypothetical protein